MPCGSHDIQKKCKIEGCENLGMFKGICAGCKMMRIKNVCHKHSVRESVRKEYSKFKKESCEKCGAESIKDEKGHVSRKEALTIHHIDGNILNNEPNNLMTLCRKCHDEIEGIKPHKEGRRYYY